MKKNDNDQYNQKYLIDLYKDTPIPAEKWQKLTFAGRINIIKTVMSPEEMSLINIKQCNDNGYVYIDLLQPVPASRRGVMLLDFELKLKSMVDEAITIWHMPQGDKSSLRRLRGVELKS